MKRLLTKSNFDKNIFTLLGFSLFVYLIIRAIYVPFSHDEAATFFHYVQVGKLMPQISKEAFNNHLLNTLLTYLSCHLFGNSKLALRLPNVLSFLVYLVYIFKTAQFLENKILRWSFLLVLLFTHYFIDFFAVSRGYGISMAFFMAVLYYTINAMKTVNLKNHLLATIFSILMLTANLNLIIPFIAIFGLQAFSVFFQYKKTEKKQKWMIYLILFLNLIIIFLVYRYMNELNHYGAFYLRSKKTGFFGATINSLLRLFVGKATNTGLIVLLFMFLMLLLVGIRNFVILKFKFLLMPQTAFLIILLSSLAGIILVVHLFGINYPEDRVVVYLFPLFAGSLFFMFDFLIRTKYGWLSFVVLSPFVFFPLHFLTHINLSYINEYRDEALPARFYKIVANEHKRTGNLSTIGGANMRQFAWAYINYMNDGNENMIDWAGYPDTISQYEILQTELFPYSLETYDSIDYAASSGLTLFKRKNPAPMNFMKEIKIEETGKLINKLYYNIFRLNADTIKDKQYYFEFDFGVTANQMPFDAWLVIQVENKNHKSLIYKFIPFNWLRLAWKEDSTNFHQSIFTGSIPENAEVVKAYIWNKDKEAFKIGSGTIKIFEIKRP